MGIIFSFITIKSAESIEHSRYRKTCIRK